MAHEQIYKCQAQVPIWLYRGETKKMEKLKVMKFVILENYFRLTLNTDKRRFVIKYIPSHIR